MTIKIIQSSWTADQIWKQPKDLEPYKSSTDLRNDCIYRGLTIVGLPDGGFKKFTAEALFSLVLKEDRMDSGKEAKFLEYVMKKIPEITGFVESSDGDLWVSYKKQISYPDWLLAKARTSYEVYSEIVEN